MHPKHKNLIVYLIKMLLKLFICKVDAELLEAG